MELDWCCDICKDEIRHIAPLKQVWVEQRRVAIDVTN